MKNSLIAGLFLLFISIITLTIFTGGYALYMASGLSESGIVINGGNFIRILISSIPLLLPLSLAIGFFITFLRLRRRPGFRPLTALILFLVSTALLWMAGSFLGNLQGFEASSETRDYAEYYPETFTRLSDGSILYRDATDSTEFTGLLVESKEDETRSLRLIEAPPVISRLIEADKIPSLTVEAFSFREGFDASLFNDFALAGGKILELRRNSSPLIFLLAAAAFSLYLTSCWGVIQISRWPLFNTLTALLLLSGGGFLFRLFTSDIFEELVDLLEGKTFGIPLIILVMGGIAILLILVDLLFIPYNKRVEEL
ncbi:MAG: hypothetical protein JEY99_12205 [Spirochaetales bacterium]|nr:hypothetical protein [Spirochaetales bacterium]